MVAAVLLVASCAAYEWRNPGLPEAQWPRDEAERVGRAAAAVDSMPEHSTATLIMRYVIGVPPIAATVS